MINRYTILLFILILIPLTVSGTSDKFRFANITYKNKVPIKVLNLNIKVNNNQAEIKNFIKNGFIKDFKLSNHLEPIYNSKIAANGSFYYKYSYKYKGIPVEDAALSLSIKNNSIISLRNSMESINLDIDNTVSDKTAAETAFKYYSKKEFNSIPPYNSKKVIIKIFGRYVLAYKIVFKPMTLIDSKIFYIGAKKGNYLYQTSSIAF